MRALSDLVDKQKEACIFVLKLTKEHVIKSACTDTLPKLSSKQKAETLQLQDRSISNNFFLKKKQSMHAADSSACLYWCLWI
jgi:hypothetical protein